MICDTLGFTLSLWLEVLVLPASVQERQGAEELFWHLAGDLWGQQVWEKL